MQTQTLLRRDEVEEHEILLQGTIRAIREATVEVSSVSAVVHAQGEVIDKIERKISNAEGTLKRASRKLTALVRQSKKRRAVSICLLAMTTLCLVCLFTTTLFKR
ncbi:hypothetical protein NEHOM01_0528 [Nematocida homosporus]|uniref:uncharacterized protein n=1 Tax=Nematocida homosporus TaxID=1912981 RepID=UPI00221EBECC|nr:uncharacterized protein NEHOM01_0528 [Nematocida homosporus]KAI5184977.1 hypothetical protein NEHOM01_0528 [Nematocida homosporus]